MSIESDHVRSNLVRNLHHVWAFDIPSIFDSMDFIYVDEYKKLEMKKVKPTW